MAAYKPTAENVQPSQLAGFFAGWGNHPMPEKHLELLQKSETGAGNKQSRRRREAPSAVLW